METLPWLTPFFMAIRNLQKRLGRTLLTIVGISLGVAVMLAIEITNQSTLASIEQMFERAVGRVELVVGPKGDDPAFDAALTQVVQRIPGVQRVSPTVKFRTALADDVKGTEARWQAGGVQIGHVFEIQGVDFQLDPEVRFFNLVSGRLPQKDQYEALTTQKFANDRGLTLGHDLRVLTPHGEQRLEIVGLLADDGPGLANDGSVAFVPLRVTQAIFDLGEQVHEIAIQAAPDIGTDPTALAQLKERIAASLGDEARVSYPAARGDLVPRMLDSYQTGLFFFSIIAIFVGSFLIYNTFSMTAVERMQEIGMLRAIGMEQRQILGLILTEAGVLSIFGSLLGVVFGVLLARGLMSMLNGFISIDQGLVWISRASLLKSIGTGFLITYLAALIPAVQTARTSPLEALRARTRAVQKVHYLVWLAGLVFIFIGWAFLYRLEWRANLLFAASTAGFILLMLGAVLTIPLVAGPLELTTRILVIIFYGKEGSLGASNVRRAVMRTTLTIACLMIAMVMIIGIGSLSNTFKQDIGSWVANAMGGDLFVVPTQKLQLSFANQLADIPGVVAVSPTRVIQVKLAQNALQAGPGATPGATPGGDPASTQEDTLVFTAIDPALFRQVGNMVFVSGQDNPEKNWAALSEGQAVFISSVVAEEYGLSVGDKLVLQTRRGEQAFTVAAITTDFTGQGLVITGTYADLGRWFAESGANRFTLAIDPAHDIDAVAQQIKDRYKDRYNLDVQTTKVFQDSVFTFLDKAFMLFDVLSLIGVVIGGLGVINTLTMNVIERTQEIGGLRSLGLTRAQVVRMILAEAFAMGLVGSIFGIIFGYIMSRVFVLASATLTGYDLRFAFTLDPYVLAILIVILVAQLAAIGPARRAVKINIIDALKHE